MKEDRGKLLYKKKYEEPMIRVFEKGIFGPFNNRSSFNAFNQPTLKFKKVEDFEAIYPYFWLPEYLVKKIQLNPDFKFDIGILDRKLETYGLQLETKSKEILMINFSAHDKKKILPSLKKIFGDSWDIIFNENELLSKSRRPGKIGQVGIHHRWKYRGFLKRWG